MRTTILKGGQGITVDIINEELLNLERLEELGMEVDIDKDEVIWDWSYAFSDDAKVWEKGKKQEKYIMELLKK